MQEQELAHPHSKLEMLKMPMNFQKIRRIPYRRMVHIIFILISLTVFAHLSNAAAVSASTSAPAARAHITPATKEQCASESRPIPKTKSATINGIKSSAASALAAGCSKTLLAPFDTIKTMQQQARNGGKALGLLEAAKIISSRPAGFLELYAGLGVAVVGAMPSVGLYFGVYSYAKEKLSPYMQKNLGENDNIPISTAAARTLSIGASAAIGNTVASFSRVPYEVVKQKLQTAEYASTMQALTHMYKSGGLRAFFPMGGISIQMIRDIPYAIVTLITYEYLRENWVNRNDGAPWRDMVAGGFSGGFGSFATNPMDVVKTRLQIDPVLYQGNVLICAQKTLEEGGPSAFLRGSVPRLIHKVPANAFFFVFYEFFCRALGVD
jgi:solute carrier family 25 S-adenosylmethionine transporter 26